MIMTLSDLLHILRHANTPDDLFGALPAPTPAALKQRYRELAAIAHPDRNPGRVAEAEEAFKRLQQWYVVAQMQLARHGHAAPYLDVATRLHHYMSDAAPFPGDLCDLFPAEADGRRVLLKVVRHARNNDLLQAEARALQEIDHAVTGQAVRAHFPTLWESFPMRDAAGVQRQVNVLQHEGEYVSLAKVLQVYPTGIELADAAWMFNRLLAALAVIHNLGLVHGAVTPAHILIRPADHNGLLIDWCYSVPTGDLIQAMSPPYTGDYPPEVPARQPATAATDLYMAARCLLRLLGGNPVTGALSDRIPKPLQRLLRSCLLPAPQRRASDVWELFDDFQEILHERYGQRKFRPFVV